MIDKIISAVIVATITTGTIAAGVEVYTSVKAATETFTPVIIEGVTNGNPDALAIVDALKQGVITIGQDRENLQTNQSRS